MKDIKTILTVLLASMACSATTWLSAHAASEETVAAVQIVNGTVPGALQIKATHAVKLKPELGVERLDKGGAFVALQDLDLGTMRLVTACNQKIGKFVVVDEKGLKPVPWSGMSCSSQCNGNCDKNVPLIGHFRFVVHSFEDGEKIVGPVFELTEKHFR